MAHLAKANDLELLTAAVKRSRGTIVAQAIQQLAAAALKAAEEKVIAPIEALDAEPASPVDRCRRRPSRGSCARSARAPSRPTASAAGFATGRRTAASSSVRNGVTRAYLRSTMIARRRTVMQAWGDYLIGEGAAATVILVRR
jgi:hypothetical protein